MVKRRCVFLDRDGVINVRAQPGHYVGRWEEFRVIPSAVDWIRLFNALQLLVIVVTNQRGVALGVMTLEELEEIHANLLREFAAMGARIDEILSCVHEEGACDCRKPRPGLVLAAQKKWDIDLSQSLLIGDSDTDRELARACGIAFLLARDGHILAGSGGIEP